MRHFNGTRWIIDYFAPETGTLQLVRGQTVPIRVGEERDRNCATEQRLRRPADELLATIVIYR